VTGNMPRLRLSGGRGLGKSEAVAGFREAGLNTTRA